MCIRDSRRNLAQSHQSNEQLLKILALLVHDLKPHAISDIASILSISETEVASAVGTVNFLTIDSTTGIVHIANTGLTRYIADRLKDRKAQIQKLLIKRLMAAPRSSESLLELPTKLEEAAEYSDLVDLLTPDHLLQVLERSQTLSPVDDTVDVYKRQPENRSKISDGPASNRPPHSFIRQKYPFRPARRQHAHSGS